MFIELKMTCWCLLFSNHRCLTGQATDSSSSDDWGVCRFLLDCAVCLMTRLVTASGSSSATAQTGTNTSSPSMDWFSLPRPVERNDLVLRTVDCLIAEVDFWFAEVAEDGFHDEVRAMITYFGRRNVC